MTTQNEKFPCVITEADGTKLDCADVYQDGDDLVVELKDGSFLRYTNVRVTAHHTEWKGHGITSTPIQFVSRRIEDE